MRITDGFFWSKLSLARILAGDSKQIFWPANGSVHRNSAPVRKGEHLEACTVTKTNKYLEFPKKTSHTFTSIRCLFSKIIAAKKSSRRVTFRKAFRKNKEKTHQNKPISLK